MSEWNFDGLIEEHDDIFEGLYIADDWYGDFDGRSDHGWDSSRLPTERSTLPQPTPTAPATNRSQPHRASLAQQSRPLVDQARENHSGYIPDNFNFSPEHTDSDSATMPPRRRQLPNATASQSRRSIVDLTSEHGPPEGSTSEPSRGRKRGADDVGEGQPRKQGRFVPDDIEEIDLANEALSAEEELLQAQQQEAIRSQQAAEAGAGPQSIGNRQCIICMENYTNCTTTSCGHFYCHECLIQALRAGAKNGDRGTGTCPVCRKVLSAKKKSDVIPILFMKKATFEQRTRVRVKA